MIRTVIKFYTDWCQPCQMMKPVFENVQKLQPNHIYREINIDQDPTSAAMYGVSSIPTTIILENGGVVARKTGFMNVVELEEFIQNS